jgi:hypothetical protein
MRTPESATGIVTTQRCRGSNYTSIGIARIGCPSGHRDCDDVLAGQTITGTDVLVMHTYGGDATLDGKINMTTTEDRPESPPTHRLVQRRLQLRRQINIDDYTTVIDEHRQPAASFSGGGLNQVALVRVNSAGRAWRYRCSAAPPPIALIRSGTFSARGTFTRRISWSTGDTHVTGRRAALGRNKMNRKIAPTASAADSL